MQDRAESQSDPESEFEVTSLIYCVLNTEYISSSTATAPPSHLKYLPLPLYENIASHPSQPPLVWCECSDVA